MKLNVTMRVFALILFVDNVNSLLLKGKCPPPKLENGKARVASKRGHAARFKCFAPYQLYGQKYAICLGTRWEHVPICVKSGCTKISSLNNGQVLDSYRGAVLQFMCNPGYLLVGSSNAYCNGVQWNTTIPECKASERKAQTWCDFESQDLCGWTQDPNHHFDWTRKNLQTPSGNVGTGPSFDHTLGRDKSGYYMFIESSSPRIENDKARLFSPVYTPDATRNEQSCFIFWYHMFGAKTGSLNMYIKPEETEFDSTLLPRFTRSGDQGNQWYQAIVLLPSMNESFQVIIEAVRGAGYVSDIAIDDVKIANGSECIASFKNLSFVTESTIEDDNGNDIYDSTQSCRLRCMNSSFALSQVTVPKTEKLTFSECDCDVGCLQTATCCPDYTSYCILEKAVEDTTVTLKITEPIPDGLPSSDYQTSSAENEITHSSGILTSLTPVVLKTLEITTIPTIEHKSTEQIRHSDSYDEQILVTKEPMKPIYVPTKPTPLVLKPSTYGTKKPQKTTENEKTSSYHTTLSSMFVRESVILFNSSELSQSTVKPQLPTNVTKITTTKMKSVTKSTIKQRLNTTLPLTNQNTSNSVPIQSNFSTTPSTVSVPQKSTVKNKKITQVTPKQQNIFRTTRKSTITAIKQFTEQTVSRMSSTIPPHITQQSSTKLWVDLGSTQATTNPIDAFTTVTSGRVTRGKEWIEARRGPVPREENSSSYSNIIGIFIAVIVVIAAVGLAMFFVLRHRRRYRRQSYMADDSDVRFLTSDEALDFSLARPTGCGEADL